METTNGMMKQKQRAFRIQIFFSEVFICISIYIIKFVTVKLSGSFLSSFNKLTRRQSVLKKVPGLVKVGPWL